MLAFVMIVAEDGSVAPRPVQISQSSGNNWVVTSGLKAGEKVMVDGLIKVGMGAKKVKPVEINNAAAGAPAQPSAAAPAAPAQEKAATPAEGAGEGKAAK